MYSREIMRCRFFEGMTIEETARVFQCTRERVRQIESKAIRKLQNVKFSKLGDWEQ